RGTQDGLVAPGHPGRPGPFRGRSRRAAPATAPRRQTARRRRGAIPTGDRSAVLRGRQPALDTGQAGPHHTRPWRPMTYETLDYAMDGHVAVLTYDRPEQRNAISRQMNDELHHAWRRFRDDDEAFVLVITGAGDTTFSAGWDLQDASEMDELGDWDQFRVHVFNSPGACGYTRRVDVFKPVIAAVNGYA